MVPVIPASRAGAAGGAPQALLVVASFDPDRVIRRRPIEVICADSLVSRHLPPVCFAAAPGSPLGAGQ